MVALYEDGEMNETETFMGYTFDFMANHLIEITASETGPSFPGLWRILRNHDSKLKVYLNFGDVDPLAELTDDWEFVSISNGRLELKDVREDVAGVVNTIRTLVFEKK